MDFSFVDVLQYSLIELWSKLIDVLPDVILALIIIIIGLLIAPALGKAVKMIINSLKIDQMFESAGIKKAVSGYFPDFSVSGFLGGLVKWFFYIVFFMALADALEWTALNGFVGQILVYIPQVFVGVLILVVGSIAGIFCENIVLRALKGSKTSHASAVLLSKIAKWVIIIFAFFAASVQLQIASSLIEILFTGIIFAFALAFGLGGKDKAKEVIEDFFKKS